MRQRAHQSLEPSAAATHHARDKVEDEREHAKQVRELHVEHGPQGDPDEQAHDKGHRRLGDDVLVDAAVDKRPHHVGRRGVRSGGSGAALAF